MASRVLQEMDAFHEHPMGEELLRHASWIGSLARGLVGDEATAEDVVQDTWVAALTHRLPEGRGLRPWLNQVVRNFARQDHRGRGRRQEREARSRGPGQLPDPEELTERLEMERLLTDRLARIDEPFRSTLLLRYYEDLQPAEIARRQGIPGGTVRWRLKRGLERLRELLDEANGGDRNAWTLLLLPLARANGATAAVAGSTVAFSGLLAMNSLLKLGVAAVAIVLVAVGLTRTGLMPAISPLLDEEPVEVTFRPLRQVVDPVAELGAVPQAIVLAERRVIEAPSEAAPAPALAANIVATAIDAIVMDTFGAPLGDVRMLARIPSGPAETAEAAMSRSDGSVHLALELDSVQRVPLEFHAVGFASQAAMLAVRPGETTHAGTIRLEPGGAISGRVLDERGLPIAGALISLGAVDESRRRMREQRLDPTLEVVPSCATDERGTFELDGVPVGFTRVWARAEKRLGNYTPPVEVRAGQESVGVEIVLSALPAVNQIRGIVLDPEGKSIAGALLEYRHSSSSSGRTVSGDKNAEADGTFRFVLRDDERLWITAKYPPYGAATASDVRTGEVDLVLQLTALESVALIVFDQGDVPVENFAFEILSADEEFTHQTGSHELDDEGPATFGRPVDPFVVRVTASGFDVATVGPIDPLASEEGVSVRLVPMPGLRGVVSANGEPVAGAIVTLQVAVDADQRYEKNGFLSRIVNDALDEAETDAEGRFLLTIRAGGDYFVRAEHGDYAATEAGPMPLGFASSEVPLELQLGIGGAIEGRVHASAGRASTGAIVGISRGDGHAQTRRVGIDGTFRFDGLMPGRWLVVLRDEEIFDSVTHISTVTERSGDMFASVEWGCDVYEGETTYYDVRPEDVTTHPFEGRLIVNGEPAAAWVVRLTPADSFFLADGPTSILDGDGRFTVEARTEGDFQLVFSPQAEPSGETYLIDQVRLPQVEPWAADLKTGTLVVEGLGPWDGQGVPDFVHIWEGPGRLYSLTPLGGDEDGVCRAEGVFAGLGRLALPDLDAILDPTSWAAVQEVQVPGGGEVRASVR